MNSLGVVLLAGLLSLIVGIGVTIALNAIAPCYSDKAGCGMAEAYRLFFVPGFALLGMIAFGISAVGKKRGAAALADADHAGSGACASFSVRCRLGSVIGPHDEQRGYVGFDAGCARIGRSLVCSGA